MKAIPSTHSLFINLYVLLQYSIMSALFDSQDTITHCKSIADWNLSIFLCSIDPLYIEDPIDYVNNVGSTCFRIQQIVKVCWKFFLSKHKMGEMLLNLSSMFLACFFHLNWRPQCEGTEFLIFGRCLGPPVLNITRVFWTKNNIKWCRYIH